jgi:hypothetical protein
MNQMVLGKAVPRRDLSMEQRIAREVERLAADVDAACNELSSRITALEIKHVLDLNPEDVRGR